MSKETQPSLDLWDDFSGEFLKTDLVKEWPLVIVPIDIEARFDDKTDKARMQIVFEYNEREWKMELNRTNQKVVRDKKLTPKQVIGKKLTFDKIQVRNPAKDKMVDSFLLKSIE